MQNDPSACFGRKLYLGFPGQSVKQLRSAGNPRFQGLVLLEAQLENLSQKLAQLVSFSFARKNVDLTASRWLRPLALRDNLPWTDVLCIPVLCHPTACTRMHHVLLLVTCPWSSSYWYTTPWIFGTLHCPHCLQKTSWWIQSHQGYWPPWHLRFWSPPGGRPELGSSATNLVARPPPGGNARALFLRTLDTKVPCGTCGCKTWKHIYILSSRTLTLLNIHIAIFNEVQYIFPQNALPSI